MRPIEQDAGVLVRSIDRRKRARPAARPLQSPAVPVSRRGQKPSSRPVSPESLIQFEHSTGTDIKRGRGISKSPVCVPPGLWKARRGDEFQKVDQSGQARAGHTELHSGKAELCLIDLII